MAKKNNAVADSEAKAPKKAKDKAKVKKFFTLSFEYNGNTITMDNINGKSKKVVMELIDEVNSQTSFPLFQNAQATEKPSEN